VPVTESSEAANYSVAIWRELLRRNPADADGDIRYFLCMALADAYEVQEACSILTSIMELRLDSPDFFYLTATLATYTGEFELALRALDHAIVRGFNEIAYLSHDPRLSRLREKKPKEFKEITTPKSEWRIVYGIFSDDITLTNKSKFPLTNVELNVRLEQDTRVWPLELKTDTILPGATYTWSNVVAIPGSRLTKSKAVLSCDQDP
jgi:hypothetical protein